MNNVYNNYKQVILDRFVDDCNCNTLVDSEGSCIVRANLTEDNELKVLYEDKPYGTIQGTAVFKTFEEQLNYILGCKFVEDEW